MGKLIVLNDKFENAGELALNEKFEGINAHNLYLYVKSYLAGIRANTARVKNRSEVSGGGKKPKAQKGSGAARWGSKRSPLFVGGGQVFGPTKRNYNQKINKKQKSLALRYAINAQAERNAMFVVDSLKVESGKTKDAAAILGKLNQRDTLVVVENFDEKTYLAFRNIKNCYVIEKSELNAYLVAAYYSIVIEKAVIDSLM
ncbi:MAG: 50S ribosomal protein L4 [Campylobacterales bacterium]|nr:50S ribosomal protein L4 [Campylobacterales bacterium]